MRSRHWSRSLLYRYLACFFPRMPASPASSSPLGKISMFNGEICFNCCWPGLSYDSIFITSCTSQGSKTATFRVLEVFWLSFFKRFDLLLYILTTWRCFKSDWASFFELAFAFLTAVVCLVSDFTIVREFTSSDWVRFTCRLRLRSNFYSIMFMLSLVTGMKLDCLFIVLLMFCSLLVLSHLLMLRASWNLVSLAFLYELTPSGIS